MGFDSVPWVIDVKITFSFLIYIFMFSCIPVVFFSPGSLLEPTRHSPLRLVTAGQCHYAWLEFLAWTLILILMGNQQTSDSGNSILEDYTITVIQTVFFFKE